MRFRREEQEGIAQKTPGRGRRREEEGKIVIPPWVPPEDGWFPPWEPKPPLIPPKKCRCPSCNYEMFLYEEGARCLFTNCPFCGHRMREVK